MNMQTFMQIMRGMKIVVPAGAAILCMVYGMTQWGWWVAAPMFVILALGMAYMIGGVSDDD